MCRSRPRALLRIGAWAPPMLPNSTLPETNAAIAVAHEDLFDAETLVLEKAFGDGDAVGELVVPRQTNENDAQVFLLLGMSAG